MIIDTSERRIETSVMTMDTSERRIDVPVMTIDISVISMSSWTTDEEKKDLWNCDALF